MECYRWSLVDPAVIRTLEEMEMDQNKKSRISRLKFVKFYKNILRINLRLKL